MIVDIVNTYSKHIAGFKKLSADKYTGACPFHAESKPSFIIYPDGSYHCFGCRAHGTYLDFLNRMGEDTNYNLMKIDVTLSDDNQFDKYKKQFKNDMEKTLRKRLKNKLNTKIFQVYDIFDKLWLFLNCTKYDNRLHFALAFKKQFNRYIKK